MKFNYYKCLLVIRLIIHEINSQIINTKHTCPQMICSEEPAKLNNECLNNVTKDGKTHLILTKCPANQYCDFNHLYHTIATTVNCTSINISYFSGLEIGKLVEQDFCRRNSDCSSKNCTDNICYGLNEDSRCKNTTECSVDTYCNLNTTKCTNRSNLRESCENDDQCINIAGCFNKICTTLYSFQSGTVLSKSSDTKFCKSNFTNNNSLICEDFLNNDEWPDHNCLIDFNEREGFISSCNYITSLTNTHIKRNLCNCDINGSGFGRCTLGTNSTEWNDYITNVIIVLSRKCHFYNKYSCAITPYSDLRNIESLHLKVLKETRAKLYACFTYIPNITLNPGLCNQDECLGDYLDSLLNTTNHTSKCSFISGCISFFTILIILTILEL